MRGTSMKDLLASVRKKSIRQGRLLVQLDKSQVVRDDPGAGTPAMVHCFEFSATYWCAVDNGLTTD